MLVMLLVMAAMCNSLQSSSSSLAVVVAIKYVASCELRVRCPQTVMSEPRASELRSGRGD